MTKKQFKKSISRTLATGIILEKELSTDEVFNELIKLKKENKELNEQLSVIKSKGLKVLEFYEDKLKNVDRKEFKNAREELWIVKEVLCKMGVIKDD